MFLYIVHNMYITRINVCIIVQESFKAENVQDLKLILNEIIKLWYWYYYMYITRIFSHVKASLWKYLALLFMKSNFLFFERLEIRRIPVCHLKEASCVPWVQAYSLNMIELLSSLLGILSFQFFRAGNKYFTTDLIWLKTDEFISTHCN